jgi:hypothetical protein
MNLIRYKNNVRTINRIEKNSENVVKTTVKRKEMIKEEARQSKAK